MCSISVTEQPILLGFSCYWKELSDETLSLPSFPTNTVVNFVKINKHKKTPNKQTNRQRFATANTITSVVYTFPTGYFCREFSGSLSYQFWHQLQHKNQRKWLCWAGKISRARGTIQYFWVTCIVILHITGTALMENLLGSIPNLLLKWASKIKMELFLYLFSKFILKGHGDGQQHLHQLSKQEHMAFTDAVW